MCGVIGFYSPSRDGLDDIVTGLFQMQHRGQDACGIVMSDGERLRLHRSLGYVREVFHGRPAVEFAGRMGIGHVRYPTQGGNRPENTQPHLDARPDGPSLALCSNGDVVNYWALRQSLEARGVAFEGTNDGELMLRLVATWHIEDGLPIVDALRRLQVEVKGAYSACLLTVDRLYAFRDPWGVRPMSFGQCEGDWQVASETVALDINRMELVDEVQPGEIIVFSETGPQRLPHPDVVAARDGRATPAHCVFEHVYFSRPDALVYGRYAYDVRKRIGAWLARHDPIAADLVVPVPDSSNAVALGYAQASGLPYELGLVRNHYIGRTFIRPEQSRRDDGVKMKFNPVRHLFEGRRVILVDDSIVRGTTSRKLVRMIRGAGAREVHLRVGSPVTANPCFYGIDTPTRAELIGAHKSVEDIREYLTADTLRYVSVEGLKECVGDRGDFCMACFDGKYPIALTEDKRWEVGEGTPVATLAGA
ncbi:MAG: amidophosphoribosyltransferase [Anaerolineae bacterium]